MWRKVRERKRATDPLCERCKQLGRTTATAIVHHILPLVDGGARLDMANLQSLCVPCHAEVHKELAA